MQKKVGVTDLLFELQLIEIWQAQYLVYKKTMKNNEKMVCTHAKNTYKFLIFGECKVQK